MLEKINCISSNKGRINVLFLFQNMARNQGRSQPHSPGWARVPLSSFFRQISINFSSNFTYFLPHFGPPGGRVAPGKALATPLRVMETTKGKDQSLLLVVGTSLVLALDVVIIHTSVIPFIRVPMIKCYFHGNCKLVCCTCYFLLCFCYQHQFVLNKTFKIVITNTRCPNFD